MHFHQLCIVITIITINMTKLTVTLNYPPQTAKYWLARSIAEASTILILTTQASCNCSTSWLIGSTTKAKTMQLHTNHTYLTLTLTLTRTSLIQTHSKLYYEKTARITFLDRKFLRWVKLMKEQSTPRNPLLTTVSTTYKYNPNLHYYDYYGRKSVTPLIPSYNTICDSIKEQKLETPTITQVLEPTTHLV